MSTAEDLTPPEPPRFTGPLPHPHLRLLANIERVPTIDTKTREGRANLATVGYKIWWLCNELNDMEAAAEEAAALKAAKEGSSE